MLWFNKKNKENRWLKITAVFAFIIMVTCNSLANILPLNGITTGAVSDSYPNLFAPIGFTFAIWGVIYLLLALFCVYQFTRVRGKKSQASEKTLNAILPYFIVSSILNSAWIFAWHYRHIGVSVLLIVAILVCLIQILRILRDQPYKAKDYAFVRLPFSIYFGWITVAVIADITTWLVAIGWNGWGFAASFWTIVVLVVGGLIGVITSEKNHDLSYLLVIIWAYFGILAKHVSASGFNGEYRDIIAVLVILLGLFIYKAHRYLSRMLQISRT